MNSCQDLWKRVPISEKLKLVAKLRTLIERDQQALAEMITKEMGKVIGDSLRESSRLKLFCDHALERAEEILSSKAVPNPDLKATMNFEALGIIFAITPWNVPIATPLRIILPALLAGNGVIVKPAPNVTGSALLLSGLLFEAGFPKDICKIVCLENIEAENLIGNPLIKKISFVGSGQVGRRLASIAGSYAKPILLELGGSDPFIVLNDAEIEQASQDATAARCANAGQVCCAAKRIIVEDGVYDDFVASFVAQMRKRKVGDPMQCAIGPLARKDIRDKLISQVNAVKKSGAKILLDGGEVSGKGFYFSPMVFEENGDHGFSTNEEFFGPVASVFRATDKKHAIKIANLSSLGLGSAIYSRNIAEARALSFELENGFVYINRPPGLHPYIPFGGVKGSGYGKDCGDDGFLEYVNKKIVIE